MLTITDNGTFAGSLTERCAYGIRFTDDGTLRLP